MKTLFLTDNFPEGVVYEGYENKWYQDRHPRGACQNLHHGS